MFTPTLMKKGQTVVVKGRSTNEANCKPFWRLSTNNIEFQTFYPNEARVREEIREIETVRMNLSSFD